ncbi:MAG: hypothetical protein QOI89_2865 [Solirubrobacteraceae bacterium]|jgi:hypothetical protein|nr:hypothetical protein [Solirubrobacteraceae bacterium]
MSAAPTPAGRPPWGWLPAWLRPRSAEVPGSGQLRLVETTLLVLVGVLLAVATVNDVVRQTNVNHRLIADLRTWRAYTGHGYHNLSIEQELFGAHSGREVVCGNTSPGAPKARTQLCLAIWGPVVDGRRTVHGGWYLPARSEDVRAQRYACFGPASRGICPR